MKRVMAAGLVVCMMFSGFMTTGYASPMKTTEETDIQNHWAEKMLNKWSASGVMSGYPDGTLRPDQPITRAEFSLLLQRVFGIGGTGQAAFRDVPANAWYAPSLAAALQAGYITGYDDGTFRPHNPITRAESAVMLSRAFQLSDMEKGMKTDVLGTLTDKSAIPPYSVTALKELIMAGAIQGYPDGFLRPGRSVTRGEAVALLDRLAGTLYNKAAVDERKETLSHAVVNTRDIILRNKEISGNLYLAQGIGDGDVTLDSTAVAGITFINGGGPNSIHIQNTNLAEVVLDNPDHPVRVVVEGKSVIQRLVLRSPAAVQTTEGATIQDLVLQKGSSETVISGKGEIVRVQAEAVGIEVNGQELEPGKAFLWSPDREVLSPADKNPIPAPGNTGNPGSQPSVPWSPAAAHGSLPGTTNVTASVAEGNRLAVLVSNKEISAPQTGELLMKSSLSIDPYEPGTDISGVDPRINKYLGVYEADKNGKIVRFRQIALTDAAIRPEAWNLVWDDEFDGTSIDASKWNFVQGGGGYGNNELQHYTNRTENARIEDGHLVIEALKEDYQGNAYTSAKLTTEGKGDWTYGKFEVRARMPQGKGIWPAIWMMPKDQNLYSSWPAGGEIDIMELLGHEPDKIYGTLHYGLPHEQAQGSYNLSDGSTFADDFHTFGVEWEPGEFRYYVDGVLYAKQNNWFSKNPQEGGEYTYPAPFDRDFFMQLNLAVGGNWPGNPDPSTVFPQKMLVDYIRVYEREGLAYRQPILPAKQTTDVRDPGADGNYVENGSFGEGLTNWVFQPFAPPADLFGGEGSVENDQGSAKTTMIREGDVNYAIQLVQTGLPLIKGSTYQLFFDAWSSGDRTMIASLSGPDRSYTRYMDDQTVSLTAERQTYSYTFTIKANTDPNARLEFNMGNAGMQPIWVDQVRLFKIADPDPNEPREPLPSGNLIYNGTFDQGKDRLGFWEIEGPGSAEADYYVGSAIDDRKLYVKPASAGQPDALLLSQDRLNLAGGKSYILTFNARAESDVSLTAQISDQEQTNPYAEQAFAIGTEPQSYSMIFTTGSGNNVSRLAFGLGALSASLKLDHVSLKELRPPVTVNGIKRLEAEHYSDMKGVQKGEDGLSVGWIDPGDWMQYILDVQQAGEYKISYFVASGYEGGGSLTLFGRQGSVFTHTLPAGEIPEQDADFKSTMDIANTGDWGTFQLVEQTQTIQLQEGIQTLQLYAPHVNVDYLILTERGFTGNLIRNGTFDADVSEWLTYQSDNKSDKLSITAKDGAMQIQLPELMPENWNQQVYQDGLALEQGKTYTLTFDAYSTVDRPIQLGVGYVDPVTYAYTDFLGGEKPTVWLTSERTQQQFSFVMTQPTGMNAKLEFDLGQIKIGETVYDEAGDVFLDNIRLSSSLIQNGLFDEDTDQWTAYWGDEWNGNSAGSFTPNNGEMWIEIDTAGSQNWNPQISQEGIRLEEGKTYQISFDARASIPRKINFGIGKKLSEDPWYVGYFGSDVALTADRQRYTFTFTMNGATEDHARIDFNVGEIDGMGSNTNVFLDNVILVEADESLE
ncbi:carbohydrate binding domain-containing protein [Paenibacillus harenae]|uniref:Beta-glucanase (GH16 family) n=1 Tax=Paenibacillus harenae TaxID=306543 RepID=A0ABT9UAG2_PAEHA|nr:carbohydrate binding domain-containing protein [Paenibacillus harenae]MDQ0116611.1 beta-glucanase (GH16 family) [Paenibacillus harenae]